MIEAVLPGQGCCLAQQGGKGGSVNEVSGQNALMDTGGLERPTSKRQPNYVFSDVLIPMSTALDLAEGREEVVV